MKKEAAADPSILTLSMDAKTGVRVGDFDRGGRSRVAVQAADHDFRPETVLTPWGILSTKDGELHLSFTAGPVTADFIVDRLEEWWMARRQRFPQVRTLLLHLDNGPECNSRRTRLMERLVEAASKLQVTIRLAYYPPYHSKYNPVERCWGALEKHWNGSLLSTTDAVLGHAATMTWKKRSPTVQLVPTEYKSGVRLKAPAMREIEKRVKRHPGLEKWFVDIPPAPPGN